MSAEKLFARLELVENQVDYIIARRPRIIEQLSTCRFEMDCRFAAQIFERRPQRSAPGLVPAWLAAGLTTTIANPTADPVKTAPRTAFAFLTVVDFYFSLRR